MLSVIILNVAFIYCYGEWHYAECLFLNVGAPKCHINNRTWLWGVYFYHSINIGSTKCLPSKHHISQCHVIKTSHYKMPRYQNISFSKCHIYIPSHSCTVALPKCHIIKMPWQWSVYFSHGINVGSTKCRESKQLIIKCHVVKDSVFQNATLTDHHIVVL